MSLHISRRSDGQFAFYIDGDLQFDSVDEAIYHESMALPALSLLRRAGRSEIRALICGGGDGLALRECLRFPGVTSVELVDYDPDVVQLGRTAFSELNCRAFDDSRVTVHIQDAWQFLETGSEYDLAICDFTVPRSADDTRVFTVEWYSRIRESLAPHGIACLNGVSPTATPEAFWCLDRTIRSAGLHTLPYRVRIPSFRDHGYGIWGFLLASRNRIRVTDLVDLECPVETRQADLGRFERAARFRRAERALSVSAPIHSLDNQVLLRLLLNPNLCVPDTPAESPYDLQPLLDAIPIVHTYHTREMMNTLGEQVAAVIRSLDLRRLIEALLQRASRLSADLVEELRRLRAFLSDRGKGIEEFRTWCWRLFAALVITMTLANAIAPDNAFAKGSAGLGHASFSRGYSGGFGGGRGGGISSAHVSSAVSSARVTGGGFRGGYSRGRPVDVTGYAYRPRFFHYCGGGFGHSHTYYIATSNRPRAAAPAAETHAASFVADDDLMVLDNGDVVVTLTENAYLLLTGGTLALFTDASTDPLVPLYPDAVLFQTARSEIEGQRAALSQEIAARKDWLSWVGWTSSMFSLVRDDRAELRNLEDLNRRLTLALDRIGQPAEAAPSPPPEPGAVELFVGGYLMSDGAVTMRMPSNRWMTTDGRTITIGGPKPWQRPCPKELASALKDVIHKLKKELAADIATDDNDIRLIEQDASALQRDLSEYQNIQLTNYTESDYEVDYGTESIPVGQAIQRTLSDIEENRRDWTEASTDRAKEAADLDKIDRAITLFGW